MTFLKLSSDNVVAIARAVAGAVQRGMAIAPVFGGSCMLATAPEELRKRFGVAYRVSDTTQAAGVPDRVESPSRAAILRLLADGGVVRLGPGDGIAVASHGLERELVRLLPEALWLGVPDEVMESGELADELGSLAAVVVTSDEEWRPGPTVFDFAALPVRIDRRGKVAILDAEAVLGGLVRLGPGIPFSILVVCTGNSCRSPMAAGLLAKLLAGVPAFVYSAGTGAPVGNAATREAVEAARGMGIDITRHRAQQLTAGMVSNADLVLVMSGHHREYVVSLVPEARGRTRLLFEFVGQPNAEVEDPIGRPLEAYEATLELMRPALEQVAADCRYRLGR